MARAVPLSRFTSQMRRGSAFFVRQHRALMKQEASEMSSRQIFLFLGVIVFSIVGLLRLAVTIFSPSWSGVFEAVTPLTIAFLAYREIKKIGKRDDHDA